MYTKNLLIVVTFLQLFTAVAHAEKYPAHIVFAVDHSPSMHMSGNLATQTDGLVASLEQYVDACSKVRVSYIAWGGYADQPRSFFISDTTSRLAFTEMLQTDMRYNRISHTIHSVAINSAISHIRNTPAAYSALVFITDEHGLALDVDLPERTMLFKISIGDALVKKYVAERFMPRVGQTMHATSAEDITSTINEVFGAMTDACVG